MKNELPVGRRSGQARPPGPYGVWQVSSLLGLQEIAQYRAVLWREFSVTN